MRMTAKKADAISWALKNARMPLGASIYCYWNLFLYLLLGDRS